MKKVVWTEKAQWNYAEIIDHLSSQSVDAALELDEKIEKLTALLATNHYLCKVSAKNSRFRLCVVSKNYSLVYEIVKNLVLVVAVIDNRSNVKY